jgi:hypothetical protein
VTAVMPVPRPRALGPYSRRMVFSRDRAPGSLEAVIALLLLKTYRSHSQLEPSSTYRCAMQGKSPDGKGVCILDDC